MDIEVGNNVIEYSAKYATVIFVDVGHKIPKSCGMIFQRKKRKPTYQVILGGASGALRPGRLTFILGPSGAGKTTLLKILAGRKKSGVSGSMHGVGRKAVLVDQHATFIDTLTASETLRFAASLKLPKATTRDRQQAIDGVSRQLGISDVLGTRAGLLSGGERKRLTVACELLSDPQIMLLDEPTSGLDSVSSMSVVRALRNVVAGGRTVACVIHQPSSKLYGAADDIILLASGRTLYSGALTEVPATLSKAGFTCPLFYNMADYLLEVASGEHTGNLELLQYEARCYAEEMRTVSRKSLQGENGKKSSAESEALLDATLIDSSGPRASFGQQLTSLLWRCFKGALRDLHLTQIRVACHFLVALLLGALYHGAGAEADRMMTNTACLFFFLLFLFFANSMPTIQSFPIEATVVIQEHLNKWYSLTAYCISKIAIDLPLQVLCATVFIIPAWYLTSQPMDFRLGMAWIVCVLVTILAQTFGLLVGTAFGLKLGVFVVPAANIPMVMFSEFFIPFKEMPDYLRPLAKVSYFRYSFDGLIKAVYGFGRPKLPCDKIFCMFKYPDKYLEFLGLDQTDYYVDIYVLLIWIFLLQIAFIVTLKYRVYRACR